jgi:hypothetical protein
METNLVERHAAGITEAWGRSVTSIVEVGRRLVEAKEAIPHGGWLQMFKGQRDAIEHPLPFDESTARRLMKIAKNPVLSNPAYAPVLPGSWIRLYELTKFPMGRLQAYVTGEPHIRPEMKRKEIRALQHRDPEMAAADLKESTPLEIEKRLRKVVEREMWRMPKGQEGVVNEILHRIVTENEAAQKQLSELNDVGRQWLQSHDGPSLPSYWDAKARVLKGRVISQEDRQVLVDALQAQHDGWAPNEELEAPHRRWSEALALGFSCPAEMDAARLGMVADDSTSASEEAVEDEGLESVAERG